MARTKSKRLGNSDLAYADLSGMTVSQLKDYIKKLSPKIVRDRNSKYKSVSKSSRYIMGTVGTRRVKDKNGKYQTKLIQGFGHMRKDDLLKRARLLQGHMKINVYSKEAKQRAEEIRERTLESFFKSTGVRLTKEEMADFRAMMGGIEDIVEKFGSDNIAKMYDEVNRRGGAGARMTLGSIIREVYDNMPEGSKKQDLLDELKTYIDLLLAESEI